MAARLLCDRAQLRELLARLGDAGSGSTARAREHGQRLDGRVGRRVRAHLGREAFRRAR